jgi:hypothetical protein
MPRTCLVLNGNGGEHASWSEALRRDGWSLLDAAEADRQPESVHLLVISVDGDEAMAQLAEWAERCPPTALLIVAWMASPVGIQGPLATLLAPVSEAEIVETARLLVRYSAS